MSRREVATMSAKTVDVLMPVPEMDAGFMAGFTRMLGKALDDPSLTVWAMRALESFPTVPALPELKTDDCQLPAWEEM